MYAQERCTLFDKPPLFTNKQAYVGCYRQESSVKKHLANSRFHFKNPKVVYHKVYDGTPYVIFPNNSHINFSKSLQHLNTIYKRYTVSEVLKKFPTPTKSKNGIELYDLSKADFLPAINLYSFYKFNKHTDQKILLLHDGVYSIESIYKQLNNPHYIKKINNATYEINIPIVILPTASLVIRNKTIHLQALPHPVFIIYYGKLYAAHSKFYTWDNQYNRYCKREYVPQSKILYTNYEKPRPYFLGLAGSKSYFVNNIFKGLGFHSTTATFGLSVLLPKQRDFYPLSQAFYYFVTHNNNPTGAFIGNDVYDGLMAFYTNGGKNIVYLGNYTHDNVIYNFDPHDYSKGLVIARNLSIRAKKAHGIIISRGCNNNYIAENITLKNNANGIMIDRSSNHNFIYNNLSYGNGFMGISIIESNDILIKNNTAVGNLLDGIIIRNTLNITARDNILQYNGKNGIEVMSKNIDHIPGRNFVRDPYAKASTIVAYTNNIQRNYNSNIMVKNGAAIRLYRNAIPNNYGLKGDLNFFYKDIINAKGNFTLYGLGFPYKAQSSDTIVLNPSAFQKTKQILIDISNKPNDYTPTTLGGLYLGRDFSHLGKIELIRAASISSKGALEFLGYTYLKEAQENNYSDQNKIIDGMSFIIEDAILSKDSFNFHNVAKTHFFLPNGKYYLEKGFHRAMQRMSQGRLFDEDAYKQCPLCDLKYAQRQKILGAYKVFRYKYKQSAQNSLLEYCQYATKGYTIFTTSAKLYFDKLINEKNRIQNSVAWYNRKTSRLAQKNKVCNKYLIKQKKDNNKRRSMMELEKQKRINLVKPKLKELLQKINQYRVRKISMQQLLNMMNHNLKDHSNQNNSPISEIL